MLEGRVVQSGKYDELLKAGLYFGALVSAHESSMDIAETGDKTSDDSAQSPKLAYIALIDPPPGRQREFDFTVKQTSISYETLIKWTKGFGIDDTAILFTLIVLSYCHIS